MPPPQPGSAAEARWRTTPADVLVPGNTRAHFDIESPGILPMTIAGALLTVITLGIYRFWFIVRLRQALWLRARLAGSTFEYCGTVGQVFRGFLVALVLLAPIWGLYIVGTNLLQTELYRVPAIGMTVAAVVGFFFFIAFATYRGRRYRISRTLWRGVRFRQTGSGVVYALMTFGWWLAAVLTLGLSIPFARAQLERYRINHMWFGDRAFRSRASGGQMFLAFLAYYATAVMPVLLAVAIGWHLWPAHFTELIGEQMAAQAAGGGAAPEPKLTPDDQHLLLMLVLTGTFAVLWLIFMPMLLWPLYRAREARAFIGRISIGRTHLASTFSALNIYGTYVLFFLINTGIGMAIGIAGLIVAAIVAFGGKGAQSVMSPQVWVAIGVGFTYGAFFIAIWVLRLRLFLFGLTAKLVDSITVVDLDDLQDVVSRPDPVGALGDDFAGGFDIGAF